MDSRQPPLSVDISVFGRHQAYRLAGELDRRGVLHRLYTSYPKPISGIDAAHICNAAALKAIQHVVSLAAPASMRQATWQFFSEWFDGSVAARVDRNGASANGTGAHRVLHAWASYCLETLRAARRRGITTFLECSCPHPAFKKALLEEEAGRIGVAYTVRRQWIDRVVAECEEADHIVVPSQYTYDSFVGLGYSPHTLVKVPLGVDVDEITPGRLSRDPSRPFQVLMVGTDALRKAPYDLLLAWRKLAWTDGKLVIRCGVTGAAAHLLHQPGVTHVRPIDRAQLIRLYQDASVFCFPSIDDGFGMVVLEAMAAGLPVIVTEHVGARDLITDGVEGFVVPIRDPDAIAEKLQFFYEHPEAVREMGRNARSLAERFTWSRYGDAMIRAYER